MSQAKREHTITNKAEKWRYRCPEGHTDWRLWNGLFCCRTCKQHRDVGEAQDSVYEFLVDQRTGDRVTRDDLVIEPEFQT